MRKTIASLAVLAALATGGYATLSRPCATEDSVNCTWDASTRGDHTGRSFTTVGTDRYSVTVYAR